MKQKIVNNVRVFLASILAVKFDLSFRLVCILTLKYSHSVYRIESWNINRNGSFHLGNSASKHNQPISYSIFQKKLVIHAFDKIHDKLQMCLPTNAGRCINHDCQVKATYEQETPSCFRFIV